MPRRRGRRRLSGGVITNAIHIEHDKNERFVIKKCLTYLQRHFQRHFILDRETMEMLCWSLGQAMELVGEYLLDFFDDNQKSDFEEDLIECGTDADDYAWALIDMLKKVRIGNINKFKRFILSVIKQKAEDLKYNALSDIEKNILILKKMFKLSEQEIEFCTFMFIIATYDKPESFFESHLNCHKFSGQKYLSSILDLNQYQLNGIFRGNLERTGIIEIDKYDVELNDDFLCLFKNPSNRKISEKFYSPIPCNEVPLDHHFISKEELDYILKLLKDKSSTSVNFLLYGPPGTGKSTFAYGIAEKLKIPAYEIVRDIKNDSENRRSAILACLNMTNTGDGSLVLVDEADNLLNTQNAWFMRGETQDKGWLNKLMEEPGARIIWVTNSIDGIEESVLRRFAYSIHFKSFNQRQRIKLWNNILRRNKAKRFFNNNQIEEYAKKFSVSAGVIDLAVKKANEINPDSKKDFHQSVKMTLIAHKTLKNYGQKPVDKDKVEKNYTLNGLNIDGNIEDIFVQLKKFNKYLLGNNERRLNFNLLFYGPPGAGKSELARHIADHLEMEIICKRFSDLQSKWIGEGEKNIRDAFEDAEAEEAILIIDEAESMLFSRDRAQQSWEMTFTNEFLTQMERFRGILICTTNRLKDLDDASIRRFNYKIGFNYFKPEGNVIFYQKLLEPLLSVPMDESFQGELKKINNLAPGDFKIVRDRYSFYPQKDLSHEKLIKALQEESKIKDAHMGNKHIGF